MGAIDDMAHALTHFTRPCSHTMGPVRLIGLAPCWAEQRAFGLLRRDSTFVTDFLCFKWLLHDSILHDASLFPRVLIQYYLLCFSTQLQDILSYFSITSFSLINSSRCIFCNTFFAFISCFNDRFKRWTRGRLLRPVNHSSAIQKSALENHQTDKYARLNAAWQNHYDELPRISNIDLTWGFLRVI